METILGERSGFFTMPERQEDSRFHRRDAKRVKLLFLWPERSHRKVRPFALFKPLDDRRWHSGEQYLIQPLSPLSINRRIASEREGLGSGCRSIQAVIAASNSGGMRRPRIG